MAIFATLLLLGIGAVLGQSPPELSATNVATTQQRGLLLTYLFTNYNIANYPTDSTVVVALSPASVNIDQSNNIMNLVSVYSFTWFDPRLRWDPTKYGGINSINVPSNIVTIPDLTLWNSPLPALSGSSQCFPSNAVVQYTGQVQFFPQCATSVYCSAINNLLFAASSAITCPFTIASWSFLSSQLTVAFSGGSATTAVDTTGFLGSSGWVITGVAGTQQDATIACCPAGTYSQLVVNITVQKQPHYCFE